MVSELREFVDADKVIFGMRECLRNGKKLGRVFIASDTRHEMHDEIKKLGIEVEQIELSKKEISDKLGIEFLCEVFGVKK
ncbi:MAG TPA: hypothetical protein VJK07_01745 [Candidatus Nanoarchaeia archaeon]|nr:hypothetical protein [Candidatus Nanoarchaeia archaeon]